MKQNNLGVGCACCPLNRRRFLARSGAAAAGALATLAGTDWLYGASQQKTRIRVVYAAPGETQTGAGWPNQGFDFRPAMRQINATLAAGCQGFEFASSLAGGEPQAKALLKQDQAAGNIDGYLVYQMHGRSRRVVQTFADSGKPVLYADFQFGGGGAFLGATAGFLRNQTPNVGFVASSSLEDVVQAVQCFQRAKQDGTAAQFAAETSRLRVRNTHHTAAAAGRRDDCACLGPQECASRCREARILAVRDQHAGPGDDIMGVKVQFITFAELNQAWQQADKEESRAVADRWTKAAKSIEGVSRQTLESSAAMYLAEKSLLKKYGASGITINCLGGFYGGHIQAYPCLGFYQLNSDGLVGGCECDIRSAATMLVGNILTAGRPGYISDPVLDTAKGQIIYAHCVAHNKSFGPAGPANAFEILTHSEDRQGASIRSLLPTGYLTTSLQVHPDNKEILLHQALALANDPDDRACRTKLCARPLGDFEKLFRMWDRWGWHRVTFYGDIKAPVYALAEAVGWKVLEEA